MSTQTGPTTRTRITATPLYPGSFMPEPGTPVEIPTNLTASALAAVEDDGRWFAIEVTTETQTRWSDGAGGERWASNGDATRFRIYAGETFTIADMEARNDDGRYEILLRNMRGNGWDPIVKTRAGNFQPKDPQDVVVAVNADGRIATLHVPAVRGDQS